MALSYIIRKDAVPSPLENQVNLPDNPNSATGPSYDDIMDEQIDYAPHSGVVCKEDNATVFQILQDMVAGTSFESYLSSAIRGQERA